MTAAAPTSLVGQFTHRSGRYPQERLGSLRCTDDSVLGSCAAISPLS